MSSQYSPHLYFSSAPRLVWHAYTEYLWNPLPGSWVGQVAYSFRILAFLLILPVVILTLLDITSYVIARTLGIVDDVKASTSDQPVLTAEGTPSILVEDTSSEDSLPADQDSSVHRQHNTDTMRGAGVQEEMKLQAYFTGEEDLQLSSVGFLSPSPSQPSSPVLPHEKLPGEGGAMRTEDPRDVHVQDDPIILRRRGAQVASD
ncbi:hypothetical protein DEU56DRAFT_908550 [Suillus clintonianus]|uniref:uncharacterized protein n=1 Tax=Suillus clintonianus TaxID=1904413 RepID=UPI001B87D132|nr:uncharacterized protein DEU56DRAFT_908550 [Suillus clintonianus]KAG2150915.1 hypothetical protein DEU56DRAFT_908550 [Suillus clintonianus]